MIDREKQVKALVLARLKADGRKLEDLTSTDAKQMIDEATADLHFADDISRHDVTV